MSQHLLTLSPELEAAIAKQRRKSETLEALLLRLLFARNRRQDAMRFQHLKSLRTKLQYHQDAARRESETVARLQRELDTLIEPEDPDASR